jgi:hypothetical protein
LKLADSTTKDFSSKRVVIDSKFIRSQARDALIQFFIPITAPFGFVERRGGSSSSSAAKAASKKGARKQSGSEAGERAKR